MTDKTGPGIVEIDTEQGRYHVSTITGEVLWITPGDFANPPKIPWWFNLGEILLYLIGGPDSRFY